MRGTPRAVSTSTPIWTSFAPLSPLAHSGARRGARARSLESAYSARRVSGRRARRGRGCFAMETTGEQLEVRGAASPSRPPSRPSLVRLPRPMRARARTHRSPPARLASSRAGSILSRVFSDLSPLDADAGSPPSLPRPGVQVVRRERERAVHVVAFESPREWPSHLRGGRLRRRRREPRTPRRLDRVGSTGDRPRVLRPRV